MNIIKQFGHQGDTQWFQLKSIPRDATKVDKQFIAASERSGSFHALFGDYEMHQVADGFVINAKEECILNHSLEAELAKVNNDLSKKTILPKKDHRHSVIPKGIYFVGIQQKFDPLRNMKERVRD